MVAVGGATPAGEAAWNAVLPRNSVGTLQLKRNAVTARKISPNAVRGAHVLDGSLLATDFKSGQLPAGPKGGKGAQGATGLSGLVRVTASSPNTSSNKSASVSCPSGKKVVGGGLIVSAYPGITIRQSYPLQDLSGWYAYARKTLQRRSPGALSSSLSAPALPRRRDSIPARTHVYSGRSASG